MSNVIKFQSPFERNKDYNETCPDIALLKAIILQAVIDASNISDTSKESRYNEVEAKTWLYGNNEDFKYICNLVNYEPSYVRKIAKEIADLHKLNSLISKRKKSSSKLKKREIDQTKEKVKRKLFFK